MSEHLDGERRGSRNPLLGAFLDALASDLISQGTLATTTPSSDCKTTGGHIQPKGVKPSHKAKPRPAPVVDLHPGPYAADPTVPKLTPEQSQLVADNQGLVWAAAMKYRGRGFEVDDLVGWGQFGLIYAAQSYDPGRQVVFSTWATIAIKGAIYRAFRDWSRTVRLPQEIHAALAKGADRDQFPRAYSEHELGWSLASMVVDEPDSPDDNREESDRAVARLRTLPERSANVLRLRFGIGAERQTLQEIAADLGVTKERVRQIEAQALKTLRQQVGVSA